MMLHRTVSRIIGCSGGGSRVLQLRTARSLAATVAAPYLSSSTAAQSTACYSSLSRPAPSSTTSHRSKVLDAPSSSLTVRRMSDHTQVGAPLRKKVTTVDLSAMKAKGQKISSQLLDSKSDMRKHQEVVTAYTYPSAVHVDAAGIDVLLVGDSVGMVELGYDTTLPVTVDDLVYHCKAVSRGAEKALLVADLPFGSYESGPAQAYATAIRFLKEANMDCVKLEGGAGYAETVRVLVNGGVAVMGHIGLTPQRISVLGGFRAQGKTLAAAQTLLSDALALQDAGCFALVIECVPAEVAELITKSLRIPTIGIGAGPGTSGQVLVYHDLLGMFQHAHHAKVSPSFCKTYARVGAVIQEALNEYKREVASAEFPGTNFSPYKLLPDERDKFAQWAKETLASHQEGNTSTQQALKGATQPQGTVSAKEKDAAVLAAANETIKVY